ncbi:hypothetical protein BZG36_03499 [Bifiguratus adelaidae]|uniref:alpha-glucosidase n=1 Tax=Bifiguratus adelaidae TaxID=1938954 RepID=A0A261XZA6_9FUNG|nr:hypothetical protein BZG36_03499 [Bifiguratus adelaidae]
MLAALAAVSTAAPSLVPRGANATCSGYKVSQASETSCGLTASLELIGEPCNIYGVDIKTLVLQVDYETDNRLHVKLYDAAKHQFQIPDSLFPRPGGCLSASKANLKFSWEKCPFSFTVSRKSNNEILFSTKGYDLVFQNQYLQLSSSLPDNANIYGLGEVIAPLRRDPSNTTQTLWARDAGDPIDQNIYGTHPFYLEHRASTGNEGPRSHGVYLANGNGMDIFLQNNSITYKIIGGVFDFYFLGGYQTPQTVVTQYLDLIGKPVMMPYWSFGFHQCRWGYKNVSDLQFVVNQYKSHNIPLETMWSDIDYMDQYRDFTLDPVNFPPAEMKAFVDKLHANGQHYVPIVDAAIYKPSKNETYDVYTVGASKNPTTFMKNPDGSEYVGQVWPGYTVFPDWFSPSTSDWWTESMRNFTNRVNVDGIWLDMNEPSSFCIGSCGSGKSNPAVLPFALPGTPGNPVNTFPEGYNNQTARPPTTNYKRSEMRMLLMKRSEAQNGNFNVNYPPYAINNGEGNLAGHTVSLNATHYGDYIEYDVHNFWGYMETQQTYNTLLALNSSKRPFIIPRSTRPGSGKHAGHWLEFLYMYFSITGVLQFQLFGIPMVGPDTCGFNGNSDEELCNRWMQLSAFYPFYRNHNVLGALPQEAFRWPSVAEASRKAMAIRYSLLPYWYTLMEDASRTGNVVINPLFFEWPDDQSLFAADRQFLVGKAILVTPVLEPSATTVNGVFPGNGKTEKWYDWYTQKALGYGADKNVTLSAPLGHINVAIRGGYILPMQQPSYTVAESRKNPFELLIALSMNGTAQGNLYLDDGESVNPQGTSLINYTMANGKLTASGNFGYHETSKLDKITILGVDTRPSKVTLNGQKLQSWTYNNSALNISGLNGSMTESWTLVYQ